MEGSYLGHVRTLEVYCLMEAYWSGSWTLPYPQSVEKRKAGLCGPGAADEQLEPLAQKSGNAREEGRRPAVEYWVPAGIPTPLFGRIKNHSLEMIYLWPTWPLSNRLSAYGLYLGDPPQNPGRLPSTSWPFYGDSNSEWESGGHSD